LTPLGWACFGPRFRGIIECPDILHSDFLYQLHQPPHIPQRDSNCEQIDARDYELLPAAGMRFRGSRGVKDPTLVTSSSSTCMGNGTCGATYPRPISALPRCSLVLIIKQCPRYSRYAHKYVCGPGTVYRRHSLLLGESQFAPS
jgi:hypothetical protein